MRLSLLRLTGSATCLVSYFVGSFVVLFSSTFSYFAESFTQQEAILKDSCVREREMRKAAERDKSFAISAKVEVEEELQTRLAEV